MTNEWKDIILGKGAMIRPLYNKEWVLSTIRDKFLIENGTDELVWLDRVIKDCDGSIIVGIPVSDSDEEHTMMFGLGSGIYLDDQGLLDYILNDMFEPLLNIFEVGAMESVCVVETDDSIAPTKEIWKVLSYIIGESLSDPSVPKKNKISTADCKSHMEEKFNFTGMKRTRKKKVGDIEFRVFSNDEDECTVLSYNGRIICSYPFTNSDYE